MSTHSDPLWSRSVSLYASTASVRARHLAAALGGGVNGEYVVLCCHGDDDRILIPELAEEMERFQPFHGSVGPDEIRNITALTASVVVITGCGTGTDTLAAAFLDSGASAYLAPVGAPFGYASIFAPLFVFYELTEGRTLHQAVDRLSRHDPELAMWRLWP